MTHQGNNENHVLFYEGARVLERGGDEMYRNMVISMDDWMKVTPYLMGFRDFVFRFWELEVRPYQSLNLCMLWTYLFGLFNKFEVQN